MLFKMSYFNNTKSSRFHGFDIDLKVMLSTLPGLEESMLHAILEYECKLQGAQFLAFPPVVASGLSANTLHYISNSHIIR